MNSPFPGMDPYLEQYSRDVHASFLIYARDQIQVQLPGDLAARVEEGVAIDFEDFRQARFPDVRVVERPFLSQSTPSAPLGLAVEEPLIVILDEVAFTEREIVIIDHDADNRVVTAIELLSPTNKSQQEGRTAYRRKRREYLASGVNLVEIDLLRGGDYILAAPIVTIPHAGRAPYMISVRRATRPWEAAIYPAPLRKPLPPIKIPLRPTDADVDLDLQGLIAMCYRGGRYSGIDYRREPQPPFSPDDVSWADQLLREQGRR